MDGLYANFGPNSTKVHVVLSWGFDNNTYEIPEGNYVLQNFVLERFQFSPSQLTVFLVID